MVKRGRNFIKSRRGQIAVFVIIALVIIGAIAGYFLIRNRISTSNIPNDFLPVYDYYQSCIQNNVERGADILGVQAGYIEKPEFQPGSEYAPFSSELDFLGQGIPYWYYVSGNGIIKEQAPSISDMEEELEDYLEKEVANCDFSLFRQNGFVIGNGDVIAGVSIKDTEIEVNIKQNLVMTKLDEQGEEGASYVISNHNIKVGSRLGRFYSLAKEIYDEELEKMFLENYAVDVMYLYAPVSGIEVGCSPIIWNPSQVAQNITYGLNSNIPFIKIKGDYYTLSSKENEYFIVDLGKEIEENVNFIYNPSWPSRIEIWPTKNGVMMAKPAGESQGAGAFGFCYVPYKFVYDIYFPVLIQVLGDDGEEVFQFPISVVIDKNRPRNALVGEELVKGVDVCDNTNAELEVRTYNNNLQEIESDVEFKCLNSVCNLGKTSRGILNAEVPACINGVVIANSEGYSEKREIVSTNTQDNVNIILDRLYTPEVKVYVDGQLTNTQGMITFTSITDPENTRTVVYPQQNTVELVDGQYEVSAYIMKAGRVTIPSKTVTECTSVREGIAGFFGFEKEKCFDIEIPGQTLDNVLYSGGSNSFYAVESELENSNEIRIYASSFATPTSLEQLGKNYEALETAKINVELV